MLAAVEFNNQVLPDAEEIGKVRTNPWCRQNSNRHNAWL
jgi:hypothetical protein